MLSKEVIIVSRSGSPHSERFAAARLSRRQLLQRGAVGIAAAGVAYAAWQTLRADDELWVADDPLRAPDA